MDEFFFIFFPCFGEPLTSFCVFYFFQFAPSFGQPQNSMNMTSQFQPAFQVSAPFGPTGGQPLLHSSQGASLVAPLQQTSQQPLVAGLTAATVLVSVLTCSLLIETFSIAL